MPVAGPRGPSNPVRGGDEEREAIGSNLRLRLLERKRRGLEQDPNAATDPKIQQRLARVQERIDSVKGIDELTRAKLNNERRRGRKFDADEERARAKEERAIADAGRKEEMHNVDVTRKGAQITNLRQDFEIGKERLFELELSNETKEREAALVDTILNGDVSTETVASSLTVAAISPTIREEANKILMDRLKLKNAIKDGKMSPEEGVQSEIAAHDMSLNILAQFSAVVDNMQAMSPEERFAQLGKILQQMNHEPDERLRRVFAYFEGILQESDKGGTDGKGDQAFTDEEMQGLIGRLQLTATMYERGRESSEKARDSGGIDIFTGEPTGERPYRSPIHGAGTGGGPAAPTSTGTGSSGSETLRNILAD